MAIETYPVELAEYFKDPDGQILLLEDAFAEGHPGYIAHAIGIVARARGMTQVAREAELTREALYRSLSETGDPKLSTLVGVLKALGFRLSVVPDRPAEAAE